MSKLTVSPADAGQRLDIFCVRHVSDLSRAVLQRAIKAGYVTVNDKPVKPRYVIHAEDIVQIELSLDNPVIAQPKELPSPPILYENKDIVVIDKPPGVTVQPGVGNVTGTIADWFADKYPSNTGGLVHRLDKDTSGVLVLAKTQAALDHLKKHFKKRRIKKEYLALVFGVPNAAEGRINQPLARSRRNPLRRTIDEAGKGAITEWLLEHKVSAKFALLRVFPLTGRTHQIRVHLHFIGYPIVGDPLYVFKRQSLPPGALAKEGQLLHAAKLTLTLPSGERKTFTASLPEDFQATLERLRHISSSSLP